MPPSFVIVEDACSKLVEASEGLNVDQSSQHHHVLLLEGARGEEEKTNMVLRFRVLCNTNVYMYMYVYGQWNFSNPDTLGLGAEESALISELS